MKKHILGFVAFILPVAGLAQTLTGATVEPAEIKAGGAVKITANFEVSGAINCGLRIHFGDGNFVDYKINQEKDVPLVVPRTYDKPGDYKLMVETKQVGTLFKCGGKNQVIALKVTPVAAAAAPATTPSKKSAAADASHCPSGWKLDKKSVNRKTGAFTCAAPAGTEPVKVTCPGDLGYFENQKKGVLGCRP